MGITCNWLKVHQACTQIHGPSVRWQTSRAVIVRGENEMPVTSHFHLWKEHRAPARNIAALMVSAFRLIGGSGSNGTLRLADGRRAQWGAQQYGLGWLCIDQRRTYFHCVKCSLVNRAVGPPQK